MTCGPCRGRDCTKARRTPGSRGLYSLIPRVGGTRGRRGGTAGAMGRGMYGRRPSHLVRGSGLFVVQGKGRSFPIVQVFIRVTLPFPFIEVTPKIMYRSLCSY